MKVTFTGVDARTNLIRIPQGVEIGLLYNANPEKGNRYSSPGIMLEIARILYSSGTNVAIHTCGAAAKEQLLAGHLDQLAEYANRIQVNGIVAPDELVEIGTRFPDKEIITQDRKNNSSLLNLPLNNHSILVDSSGGRGISPKEWL